MAKRKKSKDTEIKEDLSTKVFKDEKQVATPKPKTKDYILKQRLKVRGQWKEKGEKISLTTEGHKFFLSKKII